MVQIRSKGDKIKQLIETILNNNNSIRNFALVLITFCILTAIFTTLLILQPTIPMYNVDTAVYASDVIVYENYAFVPDYTQGLAIIDVSDPKNPGTPTYVYTYGIASDIFIVGNYAYVANGVAGLAIIDISNPLNAFLTGVALTPGYAVSVFVQNKTAYIADYNKGLAIVNITDVYQPLVIKSIDLPGNTHGVAGIGDLIYVTGTFELIPSCFANNRIKIFNSSDPVNLFLINNECFRGYALETVISDNYRFTVTWDLGLIAWNASNPRDFVLLGYRSVLDAAVDLHIYNDIAYIANSEDGLSIVDVSNKKIMGKPLYFYLEGETLGVFISGNYAYVANGVKGLTIVNIEGKSLNIITYQRTRSIILFGLIVCATLGIISELLMFFFWSKKRRSIKIREEEEFGIERIKSFTKTTLSGVFIGSIFGAFVGLIVESGRILTGNTRFGLGTSVITTMIFGMVIVIPIGIIISAAFMDAIVLAGFSVTIGGLAGLMIGWNLGEQFGVAYENAFWLASGLIIGMVIGGFSAIFIEVYFLWNQDRKRNALNFEDLMVEAKRIELKAIEHHKKEELEDSFVFKFLLAKKLIEILYLKYYKTIIPDDTKFEDVLVDFGKNHNLNALQSMDFTRLKEIRNKILGSDYKINKTESMEFEKILDTTIEKLKLKIKNYDEK